MLAHVLFFFAGVLFVMVLDPWLCLFSMKLFEKDVLSLTNARLLMIRPARGFIDYALRVWPRSTYQAMGIAPMLTCATVARYVAYGFVFGPAVGAFGLIFNVVSSYQADKETQAR